MTIHKIILLGWLLLSVAKISAQAPAINISAKDITIEQAFKQIENQTSYSIAFNRTKFDVLRRISLSLKNASIAEAMTEILKGTGFGYKINGQHIVIAEQKQPPKSLSVSGYVYDAETGETLIGCHVIDSVSNHGTTANAFGYFSLAQNAGECTIGIHYLGYAGQFIHLHLAGDTTINIRLKSKDLSIGEVVIQGTKSAAESKLSAPQMGMMSMDSKEIKKMPMLLGEPDVMRAIQTLPGIQAANERSTGISVRGGSIDQNLFLLDDAPVFLISHAGGFYSIFNTDAVKDIKIYKGDIPANYGGRVSSVIDIRLKDGNMRKFSMSGGIGIIAANLSVDGPIVKDRISFMASGKYGGWGGQLARINPALQMTFYDLNLKLNAVINSKNRMYISSYNGGDNIMYLGSKYHNNTLSLRWNHVYNPKLFSNVSFIYSNYGFTSGTTRAAAENSYTWNSGIRQIGLKAEYSYYINNNNTLDFGASATCNEFISGKLEGNREVINRVKQSVPFSNRVTEQQDVLDEALYVSNQQRLNDKLSVKYGIRASFYQSLGGHWVYKLNDEHRVADSFYVAKNKTYADYFSIEPRVSLNYRVFKNSAVKASYTYTTQQTQLLVKTNGGGPLDVWFPSGVNIRPQTSSQYSVGFVQYLFRNALEASIEGYYKDMRNIIDYKDGATFLEKSTVHDVNKTNYNFEEQLRTGRGYAYGVELMLKGGYRKIDGFASYAYARSKRVIDGINFGETYLSPFDKPHTFNMFLNYDISKRVSFSANFRYQSGQVITAPIYAMELFGKVMSGYSKRNEHRLPDYRRLDLSLTIKNKQTQGKRYHGEWNFSVINALFDRNVSHVEFVASEENPDIIEAQGIYLWYIVPSISYRFNF